MDVTTQYLIDQVRLKSGLRNNQLWSDAEIAESLSDAYAELRSILIVRFAYWFKRVQTFTLTAGNNVYDLTAIPDFQMAQGVNLVLSEDNKVTVDLLPSFEDRNNYNTNAWLLGVGPTWTGVLGLVYFIDGSDLMLLPKQNAAGNYELIYTPMFTQLAVPITYAIAGTPSDFVQDNGGFIQFTFDNGAFTSEMVGGSITVDWDSPNDLWNGTYEISAVLSDTNVVVTTAWPGASFTPPPVGGASVTYQPENTIASLPAPLAQFRNFLILYSSIEVRNSRGQGIGEFELQLEKLRESAVALSKQRTQGVSQAPRVNWTGGFGGYRYR